MLYGLPAPADRAVARAHARRVAELLEQKARSRRGLVLGEPDCPYEIRWNTDASWFGIEISDRAFVVRGNRKRAYDTKVGFGAAFQEPCELMGWRFRVERLSKELGIDVFVDGPAHAAAASRALCSSAIRKELDRIEFGAVRLLTLSTHQVHSIVDLTSPEQCAGQSSALRDLHSALVRWPSVYWTDA